MSALDRWDSWEQSVDALLGDGGSRRPPPLEEVYDDTTLAAIDAAGRRKPHRSGAGSLAAGVVAAGLLGAAAALDDEPESEPVVEFDRASRASRLEPVTVHLAWGDPAASVAVVRRWLL